MLYMNMLRLDMRERISIAPHVSPAGQKVHHIYIIHWRRFKLQTVPGTAACLY